LWKYLNWQVVWADGKTYIEVVKNAEISIKMRIKVAKELGREIPLPKGELMYA
jgi:predicted RNase H-like HicB family nuclease